MQGPLQVTVISALELRVERLVTDDTAAKEAEAKAKAEAEAASAAAAKAKKATPKGKAAKGKGSAKGNADDKGNAGDEEDAGPPAALVEAGATAAIRVDGLTNPEDPGVRQKGARGERSYQVTSPTA